MKILTLIASSNKITGEIVLPASKSLSNRALIMQAVSGSEFNLENLSHSDDTRLMIKHLQTIKENLENNVPTTLNCGNAGTVFRFLTAFLANTQGTWSLKGSDRMMERPIGPLVEALRSLGANIKYLGEKGYPPIVIEGKRLKGGKIKVDGSVSSQFISALIMIAPVLPGGMNIMLENKINSLPYIQMTLGMLAHFGIKSSFENNEIVIPEASYRKVPLTIESDWSSASFWYEVAAFSAISDIYLPGLNRDSWQGDAVLSDIYSSLGVETVIEQNGIRLIRSGKLTEHLLFNFSNHPDLALPVIVTCAGLKIKGSFTGLENLRYKETDRINALVSELTGLEFNIELVKTGELKITEANQVAGKTEDEITLIKTYKDHRMALAFAPLALLLGKIQIEEPEVISKSYPDFWSDLESTKAFTLKNTHNTDL